MLTDPTITSLVGALRELYSEGIVNYAFRPNPFMSMLPPDTSACDHEWKEYQGFTDRYNYCTKCDEKS